MKHLLVIAAVWMLCSCGETANKNTTAAVAEAASTLYYNGDIVTMEGAAGEMVEAVVTSNDKIVFTGKLDAARKQFTSAAEVDLKGSTMMPGLIEQHLHPLLGALFLTMPAIAPEEWVRPDKTFAAVTTPEGFRSALNKEFLAREDTAGIFWAWGYHQLWHGELSRKMLDSISDKVPIGIWHRSCHEFIVNSAFLRKYGIDDKKVNAAPEDARKQINLKKGHFYENGMMVFLMPIIMTDIASPDKMKLGFSRMVKYLQHNGVTAFNEPGAVFDGPGAQLYRAEMGKEDVPILSTFIAEGNTLYMAKGDSALPIVEKIVATTFDNTSRVRFLPKQVKFLADGSIISQLMQMKGGYLDGHHGEWMLKPQLLDKAFKLFWDAGYQIHVHVNGDEGLDEVLGCVERCMKENPRQDHRTTIVHFANSTDSQVTKLAKLGCIVSANPYYVSGFSEKFSKVGLGPERAEAMVRIGPAEKLGVHLSLHSDLPMAPSDPLFLAWCAVTRKDVSGKVFRPDLAISRHAAIKGITIDAAHSWRMEEVIGSIKVGKMANFTMLQENPYKVDIEKLKDIKVMYTVFQGRKFSLN